MGDLDQREIPGLLPERAAPEHQWWPLEWADEVMPPGRSSPDGFLIYADGNYYLGYALDAKDVSEKEKRYFSRKIEPNEIVKFICCDRLGEINITINPDGTFITDAPAPVRANNFMIHDDPDTLAEDLETFVKNYVGLEPPDRPTTETLACAWWSDELAHKLTLTYEGAWPPKANFIAVAQAEANQ
jgi:hypothetical protein